MDDIIEELKLEYETITIENDNITIINIVDDISLTFNIDIENNEYFAWDSKGKDYPSKK